MGKEERERDQSILYPHCILYLCRGVSHVSLLSGSPVDVSLASPAPPLLLLTWHTGTLSARDRTLNFLYGKAFWPFVVTIVPFE